jgi:hypothetical protein
LRAPDQVSDDGVPRHCPPRPSSRATATSLAGSDDEVPILRFSRLTALLSCYDDAAVSLPRPVFLTFPAPPPLLLFALNLPRRMAAAANARSGMINTDLLLLLLHHH